MKKEREEEEEEPSAPFWMTTFSDMVTLILTFFILIVSYSTIELEKFRGAMGSLKGALGVFSGHESPQHRDFIDFNTNLPTSRLNTLQKAQEIQTSLDSLRVGGSVQIFGENDGILVRLNDDVLFDVGKADLKPKAHAILNSIARIAKANRTNLYVEGHTDNMPIHTDRYPSNWELSTARALSVVRYFHDQKKIPEKNLAAVGHGQYRPLVPNDSPENRAKNRRVEILLKWE